MTSGRIELIVRFEPTWAGGYEILGGIWNADDDAWVQATYWAALLEPFVDELYAETRDPSDTSPMVLRVIGALVHVERGAASRCAHTHDDDDDCFELSSIEELQTLGDDNAAR